MYLSLFGMGGNNDSQFVIFMGFFVFYKLCTKYESQIVAQKREYLTTESVEGLALPLKGVDNIHGGDSLPASVLGVGDGVTDDVLKEDLEDTAGLLVDEAADALDTTTAREAADGGLGDTLDVVAKDLAVALGAALSESLASLSTSRHVVRVLVFVFVTSTRGEACFLYLENGIERRAEIRRFDWSRKNMGTNQRREKVAGASHFWQIRTCDWL